MLETRNAPAEVSTSGPMLFARYAFPPNRLGLCGPDDAPALRDAGLAGADAEVRELARGFEGAYPYLRLIAGAHGLADPLDRRVVEAYWLGAPLSAGVRAAALDGSLRERFRARVPRSEWRWLERAVRAGSRPVHAFHVLEIFPRTGLLRGASPPILDTIDACRIRWGTVLAVAGGRLVVRAPRLEMSGGRLRIGPPAVEEVGAWHDQRGVLGGVQPGDTVSLHWGWACDRLSAPSLRELVRTTAEALVVTNAAI